MKIALVQCPSFNVRMPQLGPAYLKSSLERKGHQVFQFDFNIALYNEINAAEKKYWSYEFQGEWDSAEPGFLKKGNSNTKKPASIPRCSMRAPAVP